MREREFIDWIRSRSGFDPAAVPVGPGDDCAIVTFGGAGEGEGILITTDQVLDGVHFVLAEHGAETVGRKAMSRSLSDIAAMAAKPIAAVAAVALPAGFERKQAEAIYLGLRASAEPFDCPVVGGDVACWDRPLAITVTVIGRAAGRAGVDQAGPISPVLRSGAKAGEAICVTGGLGGAWRSSRHLTFTPRIHEAIALADEYRLGAMIDISDGLATDLGHICAASGVGAEILAGGVPIHPDVMRRTGDQAEALRAALTDGEDYELLFTLPADQATALCAAQPTTVKVTRIGTVTSHAGLTLIHPDGRREELKTHGWEHET